MDCNKYYKHNHMMTSTQIDIYKYFKTLKKPSCNFCKSNKNVIKMVHYTLSKSMHKAAYLTSEFTTGPYGNKRKDWLCNKCGNCFNL
jgi:hypothetical protein